MPKRISLSAYKKNKAASVVAPSTERRLGFGESATGREGRAQELLVETQLFDRLEGLLKKCGSGPASAQRLSNWLCAEGSKGHAKRGLATVLCYVKIWSGVLRAEGVATDEQDTDVVEGKARASFRACVCAINAVNSVIYRLAVGSEKDKPRDPQVDLVKTATAVLPRMLEAMLGVGDKPRARALHPTEHAQLAAMVASWDERAVLSPPAVQNLGQLLAALQPASVGDDRNDKDRATKTTKKRAAWMLSPVVPKPSSPTAAGGSIVPSGPQSEADRNAGVEAALKNLFARHVLKDGAHWWGGAFEGRGSFREGPEGHWSLHLRRARESAHQRQRQGKGLLGVNGDNSLRDGTTRAGAFVARDGGGEAPKAKGHHWDSDAKMEVDNNSDSDGTPSTPSTVPSEASPSPVRASPVPEPSAPEPEPKKEPDATPAVDGKKEAREDGVDDEKKVVKEPRSPPRKLSKGQQEEEERKRRKEQARRAGKEMGRQRGLERERERKEREEKRQQMMKDQKRKKEEAIKVERAAKAKLEELARQKKMEMKEEQEKAREAQLQRQRERQARALEAEEESRREGVRRREKDRDQGRSKDAAKKDGGRGVGKEAERASGSGKREKEEGRRHHELTGSRDRPSREDVARGKEGRDRAGGRDVDEARRRHDLGSSNESLLRARDHRDQYGGMEERGWGRDGRREQPNSLRSGELDLGDGKRKLNSSRERKLEKEDKRKRRRSDHDDFEIMEDVGHGEYAIEDDRDRRKKKSKKDKKDKKRDRRSESSRAARMDSEESRGLKRSRDAGVLDPGGLDPFMAQDGAGDYRSRRDSRDYTAMRGDVSRRDFESYRQRSESDVGRSGSERRDAPARLSISRHDSDLAALGAIGGGADDRRSTARAEGADKRSSRRAVGVSDAASSSARPGDSRERHAHDRSAPDGGGLPGMDVYGSGAGSPPASLDLGSLGSRPNSGRSNDDIHRAGSLKGLDVYRPGLSDKDDSPESRRKRDGGKDGNGRQRVAPSPGRHPIHPVLAPLASYGPNKDGDRGGSRAERDLSEREYRRSADRSARESSGWRGESGSRQAGTSSLWGNRRSPDRGQSSNRDGSTRWRPSSPGGHDGREAAARGRSHTSMRHADGDRMTGVGSGARLGHPGMGPAPLGMGTMGISPGPLSGAVMNDAMHERHRLDGRHRLDDQRRGGDWRRREGRSEDRWRGGGLDGGRGGIGRRDRADSSGEAQPAQEEEPEEGELVIEPTLSSAKQANPLPSPPKKSTTGSKPSRWGSVTDELPIAVAAPRALSAAATKEAPRSGNATQRVEPSQPSRERKQFSADTISGDGACDGDGDGSDEESEEGQLGSSPSAGASATGEQTRHDSGMPSEPTEVTVNTDSALERRSSKDGEKHVAGEGKGGRDGREAAVAASGAATGPSNANEPTPPSKSRYGREDVDDGKVEEVGSLGGATPARKASQGAMPSQAERQESTDKAATRNGSSVEASAKPALNGGRESADAPVGTATRTGTPKRDTSDEKAVRTRESGVTSPTGKANPTVSPSQPSNPKSSPVTKPSSSMVTKERVDGASDGAAGKKNSGETASGGHENQSIHHAKNRNASAETPHGTENNCAGASVTVGRDSTARKDNAARVGPRATGNKGPEQRTNIGADDAKGAGTAAAGNPSVDKSSSIGESGARGADAPKRRSTGDAGDLASFLRKGHRKRPSAPSAPAAAAASASTAQPPPSSSLGTRMKSGEEAPDAGVASATKPERVSVFSRLGAPPDQSKKNDDTPSGAAADKSVDASGKGSDRQGPIGLSASWGSGSAAGKDDRTPRAGGGQNWLLSAALQNTRDVRGSGKRNNGGGRGGRDSSNDHVGP